MECQGAVGMSQQFCSVSTSAFSTGYALLASPQTEMLTHHPNPDLKGNQPWPAKPSAPGLTSARSLPSFEKYY